MMFNNNDRPFASPEAISAAAVRKQQRRRRRATSRWWCWILLLVLFGLITTSPLVERQWRGVSSWLLSEEAHANYYAVPSYATAVRKNSTINEHAVEDEPTTTALSAADPTFLRRQAESEPSSSFFWAHLLQSLPSFSQQQQHANDNINDYHYYHYANVSVTPATVCGDAPGDSWEGGMGA